MSEENVEVVQRMFEAFNAGWERGDPEALFDSGTVADDLEFVVFPGLPGHPASYRGRDGFIAFMRIWTEDFEGWSMEHERLIEAPDNRVVALTLQRATGKGSGVPVGLHFGQVFEIEDGRIIRMRNFPTSPKPSKRPDSPSSSEVVLWTKSGSLNSRHQAFSLDQTRVVARDDAAAG